LLERKYYVRYKLCSLATSALNFSSLKPKSQKNKMLKQTQHIIYKITYQGKRKITRDIK